MPRNGYPKPRSEPEREFSARGATAESYNLRGQAEQIAETGAEYQVAPSPTGTRERPPTEPYPGPFTGNMGGIEAPGIGTSNGTALRRPYPETEGEYPDIGIGHGWPPRYFQQPGRDDGAPQPPVAPAPAQPGPAQPPTDRGDWEDQETYVGECQCELYVGWGPDSLARQNMTAYVGKPFYMRFTVFGNSTESAAWQVGYNRLGKLPGDGGLGFFLPNQEEMAKSPKNYASGGNLPGVSRRQDAPCDLMREYWVRPRKPGRYSVWGTWGSLVCEVVVEVLDAPPPERPPEPPAESDCICTSFALFDDNGTPCGPFDLASPTEQWRCRVRMETYGPPNLRFTYRIEILDESGQLSNFIARFADGESVAGHQEMCGELVDLPIFNARHDDQSAGISQAQGGFGGTPVAHAGDTRTGTCTLRGYINNRLCGTASIEVNHARCSCILSCPQPDTCTTRVVLSADEDEHGNFPYYTEPTQLDLRLGGTAVPVDATIYSEKGLVEIDSDCGVTNLPSHIDSDWSTRVTCRQISCDKRLRKLWVRPVVTQALIRQLLERAKTSLTDTIHVVLSNGARCSEPVEIQVTCDRLATRNRAADLDQSASKPSIALHDFGVTYVKPGTVPTIPVEVTVIVGVWMDNTFTPPECCCLYMGHPLYVEIRGTVFAEDSHAGVIEGARIHEGIISRLGSHEFANDLHLLCQGILNSIAATVSGPGATWPVCTLATSNECDELRGRISRQLGQAVTAAVQSQVDRLAAEFAQGKKDKVNCANCVIESVGTCESELGSAHIVGSAFAAAWNSDGLPSRVKRTVSELCQLGWQFRTKDSNFNSDLVRWGWWLDQGVFPWVMISGRAFRIDVCAQVVYVAGSSLSPLGRGVGDVCESLIDSLYALAFYLSVERTHLDAGGRQATIESLQQCAHADKCEDVLECTRAALRWGVLKKHNWRIIDIFGTKLATLWEAVSTPHWIAPSLRAWSGSAYATTAPDTALPVTEVDVLDALVSTSSNNGVYQPPRRFAFPDLQVPLAPDVFVFGGHVNYGAGSLMIERTDARGTIDAAQFSYASNQLTGRAVILGCHSDILVKRDGDFSRAASFIGLQWEQQAVTSCSENQLRGYAGAFEEEVMLATPTQNWDQISSILWERSPEFPGSGSSRIARARGPRRDDAVWPSLFV